MVVRFLSVPMREGCDVCHRLENISGVPAAALLLMTVRDLTENVHAITRVPNCPGTFFPPPGFNHTRLPVDRDKNGCMQDHVDNWIWFIWSPWTRDLIKIYLQVSTSAAGGVRTLARVLLSVLSVSWPPLRTLAKRTLRRSTPTRRRRQRAAAAEDC